MIYSVSNVDAVKPPITAMPKGCCISEPDPVSTASGRSARIVVDAVIIMGRKREPAASMIAS